jgi:hypothetical protein
MQTSRATSRPPPSPDAPLAEGRFARVRGRRWVIQRVERAPGEDTAVHLACVEDDAAGATLEVLWERELDAQLLGEDAFASAPITRFDRPELFAAYLDTLRWSSVTSTTPDLFQSPYRAGIAIKAHQLAPLRKALLLPRANLLIADDVGIGKTIEAGLILRELILRQRIRRVVVACPPSVVLQWQDELEKRFGLRFGVLDRAYVLRVRRERGHAANPWATQEQLIVSHAILRDEAYAGLLRKLLDKSRAGSLLILDEAHNAAPASGAKYAVDSKFTRVVRDLAHRFEHRLFLSATPHNGHSNSFAALLEILDNTRFCRGAPIAPEDRDAVVVRRLKRDLRHAIPGEFPERKAPQHTITGLPDDAPELVLSRLLERYRVLREQRAAQLPKAQQAAAALVVFALQKRLLSSIYAFWRTIGVHRKHRLEKRGASKAAPPPTSTPEQLALLVSAPGMDDERAEIDEATVRVEEDAQLARATLADPTLPSPEELALLDEMLAVADAARSKPDPRIQALVDWIRENLCPDLAPLGAPDRVAPRAWNDRRLLVFTEYADTKDYLLARLREALCEPERQKARLRTFHGGMDETTREEIKAAFNADPRTEPLRILVCTDAAREGVNLQNHCADLFHFDLPWNPSRVEQRNGRIDRTLQRAGEVRCHYFIFAQRAEDQVLETMVKKTAIIQKDLGSVGTVVEGRLTALLERGIPLPRVAELCAAIEKLGEDRARIEARKQELEAPKSREEVDQELTELRKLLGQSRAYLDYSGDRLRFALDAALELLGEAPLAPVEHEASHGKLTAYRFPMFEKRAAADPSWWPLLDLLRGPRDKGEPLWDWRRRTSFRPVVFEDPGQIDSGVVHLHLEHPLARRLLSRFSAQGFVHDDLARAVVLRCDATEPQVVLFGRMALYGPEAARLHDELGVVAAGIEGKKLSPVADATAAAELVKSTLAAWQGRAPDERRAAALPEAWIQQEILPRVAGDMAVLRPLLDKRLDRERAERTRQLTARGKKEAADLRRIVTAQEKRLERHRADARKKYRIGEDQQLLDFDAKERDQLLSDLAYWDERLHQLGPQAEREAEQIQAHYEVRSARREVVGLVYLWPRSG